MFACRASLRSCSRRLAQDCHQRLHLLAAAKTTAQQALVAAHLHPTNPGDNNVEHRGLVADWIPLFISRTYVSRAHPVRRPVYALPHALDLIQTDVEERKARRQTRAERNNEELNHPDETLGLVLMLNLDPRKPNQSLRGTLTLPHGSGKKLKCVVFTDKEEDAKRALEAGANLAGGEELVEDIVSGKVAVEEMDRGLATPSIMPLLGKKLARTLGPRGLMPNPKTGTLHSDMGDLLAAMETMVLGKEIVYRTDKEGDMMVPVGKMSFGREKLLENIGEVIKTIYSVKPEMHGRRNKKTGKSTPSRNAKYILNCYVSSTQSPGFKLDLKTVDPNNAFFLSDPAGKQSLAA